MKQLVKFENNYADEFDVHMFFVCDHDKLEKHFQLAEIYWKVFPGKELEIYFGTNEFMEFCSYKDYRNSFEVSNLSDKEVETFVKFFPTYYTKTFDAHFGNTNFFYDEFLAEILESSPSDEVLAKLKDLEATC